MAELEAKGLPAWTAAQTRAQLTAVAWLRWRIFLNNFRYRSKKRSTTGLVLLVLVRIAAWFMIAGFFVAPIMGSGFLAYLAIAHHHANMLGTLTWTVFSISLFISINISPANIGFDLTPLLRFPIDFKRYLLVRLFFGLFAIPVVVANLALAAAAIGIGVADPGLFPWAALVLGVFALHNVFFIRMIFAWVDRWMATRRAREIFGAVLLFASLGFQLVVTGNARHNLARVRMLARFTAPLRPLTRYLPPSLAADAVLDRMHHGSAAAGASLLGIAAFGSVFLAIFALRLRGEFRGENFSEANRRTARPAAIRPLAVSAEVVPALALAESSPMRTGFRLPPTVGACVEKEWIYLKRSGAQLYGLVAPLFLVFILARRNGIFSNTPMLLPYAVSYVMLGLLANLYNVLGADGPGFNLYLLAPVRLRDVMLSKNLVNGGVIAVEVLLACVAVAMINGGVPPVAMLTATLSWAVFATLSNMAVGNLRSIFSPKRFELGKVRRATTAKGSGFISLGIFAVTVAAGIATIMLCRFLGVLWVATPVFVVLAGGALAGYVMVLGRIDSIALERREDLAEALTKTG